jgi:protein-L-isoaspartate O-methyltransferase
MNKQDVLANLSYFTEWGGRAWEELCRYGIQQLGNLHGKTVLEIGPRFGKMSACFALLGAQVVGIETNAAALKQAEQEAKRWGVHTNVSFIHYDGNLDHCDALTGSEFDIIFTKSVLVLLGSAFPAYLQQLDRRLKPHGTCIFLENRDGGFAFSLLRKVRPNSRIRHRRVTYLRTSHLRHMGQVFHVIEVRKSLVPPVYLIMAQKKLYV